MMLSEFVIIFVHVVLNSEQVVTFCESGDRTFGSIEHSAEGSLRYINKYQRVKRNGLDRTYVLYSA